MMESLKLLLYSFKLCILGFGLNFGSTSYFYLRSNVEQGSFPPNCWGFMAKVDDCILGAVFLKAHFDINKVLYCQHKKLFSADLSKSVRRGLEYQRRPPRWEMHMKCNLGLLPLLQFCVAKLAWQCNIWSVVAATHAAGWPFPQFHFFRCSFQNSKDWSKSLH